MTMLGDEYLFKATQIFLELQFLKLEINLNFVRISESIFKKIHPQESTFFGTNSVSWQFPPL